MTEKKYTSPIANMQYKEGILYIKYMNANISLAEVKVFVVDLLREFADTLPVRILSDITAQKTLKKEVRDYLGSPEVVQHLKASAIVADSALSKIVGNLFLMFSRPNSPTKIFSTESAAEVWLCTFP
jgi:hypothetical protein